MNTWKRYDLLKKSVSHYASCSRLDSIHIVWSEPNPPSESLKKYLEKVVKKKARDGHEVELRFDVNKEDSLNNRFKEIRDLKTDAVFSIDDDIIFPCHTVDFAFNVWESAPETMVGFVPRVHWPEQSVWPLYVLKEALNSIIFLSCLLLRALFGTIFLSLYKKHSVIRGIRKLSSIYAEW